MKIFSAIEFSYRVRRYFAQEKIVDADKRNYMNNITAVIPTRNRPDDLAKAVTSILTQTRPPDELIIVDQSPGNESRIRVESLMSGSKRIQLVYIHDPRISGLVEAKSVAAKRAGGDIVCFLEDDVVLEPDYIEQIEQGFVNRPEWWAAAVL